MKNKKSFKFPTATKVIADMIRKEEREKKEQLKLNKDEKKSKTS